MEFGLLPAMERQKAELLKENAELKEEAAKLRAELQQSQENVKALSAAVAQKAYITEFLGTKSKSDTGTSRFRGS